MLQRLLGAQPLNGQAPEEPHDQLLAAGTDGVEVRADAEVNMATHRPPRRGGDVAAKEGDSGAEREEEHGTATEAVHLRPIRDATEHLWRHVAGGAEAPPHLALVVHGASDAKVREHRSTVTSKEDVLGLQVPVHDPAVVDVREARQDVGDRAPRLVFGEGAPCSGVRAGAPRHHLEEVAPAAPLNDQDPLQPRLAGGALAALALVDEDAREGHDVGVPLHGGQHRRLSTDVLGHGADPLDGAPLVGQLAHQGAGTPGALRHDAKDGRVRAPPDMFGLKGVHAGEIHAGTAARDQAGQCSARSLLVTVDHDQPTVASCCSGQSQHWHERLRAVPKLDLPIRERQYRA
mmetsp:Transcript_95339/g.253277  ORF Transcript_95339/g.253277 Transcript_95339/m.253277 type:complete len:347 (-) Transcript_95339:462-1502(-)